MIARAVLAVVVLAASTACAAPLGRASEARRPPFVAELPPPRTPR